MTDLSVLQLIQLYLATNNERPIGEMGMKKGYEWISSQSAEITKIEGVCRSEAILSNIIAKLVTARQEVQFSIETDEPEIEKTPDNEPDGTDVKSEENKEIERLSELDKFQFNIFVSLSECSDENAVSESRLDPKEEDERLN